jgi:hypothetical protein
MSAQEFDILEYVPILSSGWECNSGAALVRMSDGTHHVVLVDGGLPIWTRGPGSKCSRAASRNT